MEVIFILSVIAAIVLVTAVVTTASVEGKYKRRFDHQERELREASQINAKLRRNRDDYKNLATKYAAELDRASARLMRMSSSAPTNTQFTKDELNTLIQLCHPDKHGGKESAVRVTQVLIKLRNDAK